MTRRRAFFGSAADHPISTSRWPCLVVALITLTLLSACSVPPSPDARQHEPGQPPSTTTAADIIEATNAERTRAGVATLAFDSRLMEAARIQAEQVAAAGRLEHTFPEARFPGLEDRLAAAGYSWQGAAE